MQNSSPIRSIHAIGSRHLRGAEAFFTRLLRDLNGRGYTSRGVVRSGSPPANELTGIPWAPACATVPTSSRLGGSAGSYDNTGRKWFRLTLGGPAG